MFGADTFSQVLRGVPQMSRSMLVTLLKELERAGLLQRLPQGAGRGSRYVLTDAGRDLAGVMTALSEWGERWVEVGPEHTDPGFALWAWCLVQLDREELPDGRVVVAFDFEDQPPGNRYYWLLVEHGDARSATPIRATSPPYGVTAESAALVDWHRGSLSWVSALRSRRIVVTGDRDIAAALPRWNLREPRLTA